MNMLITLLHFGSQLLIPELDKLKSIQMSKRKIYTLKAIKNVIYIIIESDKEETKIEASNLTRLIA